MVRAATDRHGHILEDPWHCGARGGQWGHLERWEVDMVWGACSSLANVSAVPLAKRNGETKREEKKRDEKRRDEKRGEGKRREQKRSVNTVSLQAYVIKDFASDFLPFVIACPRAIEAIVNTETFPQVKVGVALFQVGLRAAQAIVFPSSQVERDGPDAQTENVRGLLTWFFLLDSVEGWAPVTRQILRNAGVGGMFAVGKVCRAVRLMTLLLEYIWGGLRRMGCSREFPVAVLLQLLGAFDRLEKSLQVLRAGQQQTAGQGTASGVTGQGSGYHAMRYVVACTAT
uniref:Uncharacterized protein n=1 Tax=Chromera velia CCMP2878 TaxID=1169474 RepID=A0A0G4GUM2_9ALVE|eukprot:Cvel_5231.t1-p1 / transcript=Cvel_5231.t1 / gene=Cvel_5231 / organism=Chromera_velia_CCMP2878 / gene_product=hypothetical protein / transcript_product=hypothetical protein / location=Cvel_scaffold241:8664-9518(-) / protein_length=285 / sequence_SO=supercontig / SO=protein_coding / is_pseudo=false